MPPIDGELTPPDDSIRGDLEAAFADTGSEAPGVADEVKPASGADENLADAPYSESEAKSNDGRDPATGKFIPKAAPEKVAAAPDSPSTDAAKASETPASTPANAPPAGWTAAEKAEFAKLSPVVQAAVSRREAEMARGGQQWSEEKRRYEAVLTPVAEAARRNGLSTEQGLQSLLNAQSYLERDPAGAIRWLAQSHGVNLATLAGQNPDDVPSASPQQPDIAALVRQAVAPIVAPIQQRWQAEEQRQTDMTTQMVVSFAASEGHEHFDAVSDDIMAMIPPIQARNPTWSPQQVLQEAYDRSVYANPATRQSILTAREQAAEETRRKEAAARATRARGAAVSVTGSPQGSAATESAGSLREEIVRAMNG